jgi:hypothetical protein
MSDNEKRRQRREITLLQQEAVWLQKVLFALRKVEDLRVRIAELGDQEAGDWTLPVEGGEVAVADVEDAIEDQVKTVLETVRERRARIR